MRILLADDQPDVRSALRLLLEQGLTLHVTGEATDGWMLLNGMHATKPDLLLLDWELPGPPIQQVMAVLCQRYPTTPIVVLSGHPEAKPQALNAGATAFVSKGEAPDHLVALLHSLHRTPSVYLEMRVAPG